MLRSGLWIGFACVSLAVAILIVATGHDQQGETPGVCTAHTSHVDIYACRVATRGPADRNGSLQGAEKVSSLILKFVCVSLQGRSYALLQLAIVAQFSV